MLPLGAHLKALFDEKLSTCLRDSKATADLERLLVELHAQPFLMTMKQGNAERPIQQAEKIKMSSKGILIDGEISRKRSVLIPKCAYFTALFVW